MDEIPRGRGLQWLSSWPGGVPKLSLATTLRQPQVVIERLDWGHPVNSNTTIAKLSRLLKHNKQHGSRVSSDYIGRSVPAKPAYFGILLPPPSLFGVPYNRHNR